MSNEYDQFFKKVKKSSKNSSPVLKVSDLLEKKTPDLTQKKSNKKKIKMNWKLAGLSFLGLIIAATGFIYHENLDHFVQDIEVQFLGSVYAESSNNATKSVKPTEDPKNLNTIDEKDKKTENKMNSISELDHLLHLENKKKQLDEKELELQKMELSLQQEKNELAKKLEEIEGMRRQISSVLEERVKIDQQRIEKLVKMYSGMKPAEAAKIIEKLDENLAIEILSNMKEKDAASILNLVKDEKAKVLFEKYAGYKK